jgi:hypothetical protein
MPKSRAGRMVKGLADAALRFNVKAHVSWVKRIEELARA